MGALFRVKLFLPEVNRTSGAALQAARALATKPRHGYIGERRRLLVVDNEEVDRELLVKLLQPLGFELRTAASGHDCLDLLASGLQPHAILMDLAMPGIDGWETIRRLRALGLQTQPPIAIVSANAFDKGLNNDVGIRSEDFILKPVRHSELLDWLERRLHIIWIEQPPQPILQRPAVMPLLLPAQPRLDALRQLVSLGYYRGIVNLLEEIEKAQPECSGFAANMRSLARQFEFETMSQQLGPSKEPQP